MALKSILKPSSCTDSTSLVLQCFFWRLFLMKLSHISLCLEGFLSIWLRCGSNFKRNLFLVNQFFAHFEYVHSVVVKQTNQSNEKGHNLVRCRLLCCILLYKILENLGTFFSLLQMTSLDFVEYGFCVPG